MTQGYKYIRIKTEETYVLVLRDKQNEYEHRNKEYIWWFAIYTMFEFSVSPVNDTVKKWYIYKNYFQFHQNRSPTYRNQFTFSGIMSYLILDSKSSMYKSTKMDDKEFSMSVLIIYRTFH